MPQAFCIQKEEGSHHFSLVHTLKLKEPGECNHLRSQAGSMLNLMCWQYGRAEQLLMSPMIDIPKTTEKGKEIFTKGKDAYQKDNKCSYYFFHLKITAFSKIMHVDIL